MKNMTEFTSKTLVSVKIGRTGKYATIVGWENENSDEPMYYLGVKNTANGRARKGSINRATLKRLLKKALKELED